MLTLEIAALLTLTVAPLQGPEVEALEHALAEPGATTAHDALRAYVLEGSGLKGLDGALAAMAGDASWTAPAIVTSAYAHWAQGDLEGARTALDRLPLFESEDPTLRITHARVLDALGELEEARAAYEAALAVVEDPGQALELRIAVALLATGQDLDRCVEELTAAALELDRDQRNRTAVVLALLDRPEAALAIFVPGGSPKEKARDLVRVAGWQLRAEQGAEAAQSAWEASLLATLGRERRQALALCIEGHIAAGQLEAMLPRFEEAETLTPEHQAAWNEVLRQTRRFDEAIDRFQAASADSLTPEARLELLEMYREAGRREDMVAAYQGLIEGEPDRVLWRAGLGRLLLEEGDAAQALATWEGFPEAADAPTLLEGARALARVGLEERAKEWGRLCEQDPRTQVSAQLFLFQAERDAGRVEQALEVLRRMEAATDPGSPARLELSEAYEQVGALEDAVRVLESVKSVRPEGEAGEDLEMRLAWLYSEIGQEEQALVAWRDLWERVQAVPRRRYVEDRLMTVASRLGTLADLAIELEEAVLAGSADQRQSSLLVRLYTKVGDSASATEVVDEFFRHAGRGELQTLEEKARIYLATNDYFAYEEAVHRLIELDPEGEADYLRQLAMSMMERGKPDEARNILGRLSVVESDTVAAEFEAGVLALAGLREEALEVYRRGVAEHPGRIDTYLLMGDLQKQLGQSRAALGMFAFLAATADRDDLFTVAVDGVLNQFADGSPSPAIVAWTRRATLARLALQHDKPYLYQLLADLHEEEDDRLGMIRAHETSLPVAGPRVASILRELMDLSRVAEDARGRSAWGGDAELFLRYGRRLVASGELVPPQVYLDLGEAFLGADDADSARRTFALTRDMPDHERYQREAARLFEAAGEIRLALGAYRTLLATAPTDEGLLVKVAEMLEAVGDDETASGLYVRALELLLGRRPLTVSKTEDGEEDNPFVWFGARNTDDWDRWNGRTLQGLLASHDREGLVRVFDGLEEGLEADLASLDLGSEGDTLERHPRLLRRAEVLRRLGEAADVPHRVGEVDARLVRAFPSDEALVRERIQVASALGATQLAESLLQEARSLRPDQVESLSKLVGGAAFSEGQSLSIDEALRLILPRMAAGDRTVLREILLRVDFGSAGQSDLEGLGTLFGVARWLDDAGAILSTGRQWLRLAMDEGRGSYEASQVLLQVEQALEGEELRALHQYLVGRVLEKPDERADYLMEIARIQRETGEVLIEEEQVADLISRSGRYYALPEMLQLLPAEQRAQGLRENWSKVPKEMRAMVLAGLVTNAQEELHPTLMEEVTAIATEALADAPDYFEYQISTLAELERNWPAGLALLDAWLGARPSDVVGSASKAVLLEKTGETAQALEVLAEVLPALVATRDPSDYRKIQARELLIRTLGPNHADAIRELLAEVDPRDRFLTEVDLVAAEEGVEAWRGSPALDALWATVPDRFPDDATLLESAWRGARGLEAMERARILERLVEVTGDPSERESWAVQLEQVLRSSGFHARALEVRKRREGTSESLGAASVEDGVAPAGMAMLPLVASGSALPVVTGAAAPSSAPAAVALVPATAVGSSSAGAPVVQGTPAAPTTAPAAKSTAPKGAQGKGTSAKGSSAKGSSTTVIVGTAAAAPALPAVPSGAMPLMQVLSASPLGALVTATGTAPMEDTPEEEFSKEPGAVCDAVRAGDPERAAEILRRLWREFPEGIESRDPYGRMIMYRRGARLWRFRWIGPVPAPKAEEDAAAPTGSESEGTAVGEGEEASGSTEAPSEDDAEADASVEASAADAATENSAAEDTAGEDTAAEDTAAEDTVTEDDIAVEASEEAPLPQGGLSLWRDEEPERATVRPDRFGPLLEEPALVAELERVLQTATGPELDGEQEVVEACLEAAARTTSREELLEARLERLAAGTLTRRGRLELLLLLDQGTGAEAGAGVARGLVGSVNPRDAAQALRLARVLAKAGAQEEAVRLYRWCATRIDAVQFATPFQPQDSSQVTLRELVREAREVIDEDRRIDLVEDLLSVSAGGNQPWRRQQRELEVLSVWLELTTPAEALERAADLCELALDTSQGLRRQLALRVAPLFAHAGDLTRTVRALEIGLCSLDPTTVAQPKEIWYREDPTLKGNLEASVLRRLLLPSLCEGEAGAALLTALEEASLGWLREDRLRPEDAVQMLAVCGLRRLERGDRERAATLGQALARREDVLQDLPLWVADLCARAGVSSERDRIEEALLAEGRLHFGRELTALERCRERVGDEGAVELAAQCADRRRPDGLLAWLGENARAAGLESAEFWQAEAERDAAARKEFEELERAAQEKAEQAQAGQGMRAATGLQLIPAVRIGP